ncbi:MAG: hypothetical protein RLZZ324_550 [Candidatus Parcubacteria bacterium]|jgi:predicted TIM-barrel fold metal-dependent hydrolase
MKKIRIIDAHAHIGGIRRHASPGELVAAMDAANVDQSAVFAATIRGGPTTSAVVEQIAPHKDRLFTVGTVSPFKTEFQPSLPDVDAWLADGTIRALKFYTGYEHFYPDDYRLRPYLNLLVKHGRPAIFHSGDCVCGEVQAKLKFAHPLAVDDLASEMPDLRIIIAHLGSPWVTDCAQVCYKNKNVYADCSGFVYGGFTPKHVQRFTGMWETFDFITESSGKILFGTDWPISDHAPYVEVVRKLAGRHREAVFHGNAETLFGL